VRANEKAKERQEDTKKARGQQGKSEMNAEEVDDDE